MTQPISGHVFRADRKRGSVWYAKYRLKDGRQVQKKIGPAWTGRGRPPAGYFTKRTAKAWLDDLLAQARRGELAASTGATVADAAAEWLRWAEHDRACKPSTLTDYRLTARRSTRDLGDLRLEEVTPEMLERWKTALTCSNRTVVKYLVVLHGIFRRAMKVWGVPRNAAADVERPRYRVSNDIDAFSPEEVHALVRAANTQQDGCLYLTVEAASRVTNFSVVPMQLTYSRSHMSVTVARSIVLLAGLAVAALGSMGAAAASGQGEPGACGLRGCKSVLRLHFGEYTDAHKSIKRVRLCARGRCHSARDDAVALRHVQIAVHADDADPIRVTVLAYDRRGRLRLERTLRLTLKGEHANGPKCGPPICYYGTARLTTHGRLLDAGPGLT